MALNKTDPSSYSSPEDAVVKDIHLVLNVDFNEQVLKGYVELTVEKRAASVNKLVLDTRDLSIEKVKCGDKELPFNVEGPIKSFGAKLEITLPDSQELKLKVKVYYHTSPKSTALQWLAPEQTAGKQHPYLFSQCQAIHARSLLPCQDTPAVKATYSAEITVPHELVALMSAVKKETSEVPDDKTRVKNTFLQKVPIPSYLIAIVVGALECREIGPRSKVWSEKSMVDDAKYEFAETETMLKTAEELAGPYVWGVYDLLVLPPSFPYGGMENPCLTFVTPTLLAGDRSLANVVAHEIAHSWTGNLVTNKTWEHFWLNEGHTVFLERKIGGRMEEGGEKFRHFKALGGWNDLQYQIDVLGHTHGYTHLVPDLNGVDPDDAFSSVPYEKGSNLLMHLEQKLGGPDVFEPFLRAYIDKFKYQSITTDDWKTFLYEFFSEKKATLDQVDWQSWFYAPGMPPVKPEYDSSLRDACSELGTKWSDASDDDVTSFSSDDLTQFSSHQKIQFLAELLDKPSLSEKKIQKLDEVYKLGNVKNAEIRHKWLRLCIKAREKVAIEKALQFATEQGRMKFVRPIYRDLYQWEGEGRDRAIENYKQHSAAMHNLTATMVGKDLKLVQ